MCFRGHTEPVIKSICKTIAMDKLDMEGPLKYMKKSKTLGTSLVGFRKIGVLMASASERSSSSTNLHVNKSLFPMILCKAVCLNPDGWKSGLMIKLNLTRAERKSCRQNIA